MTERRLGDLAVSAIGLGCMGMSAHYGAADQHDAHATVDRARRGSLSRGGDGGD
jgi:aryl-alcohol dehydrogenase-like predicted oxidoreductase